jgi:hypothetical protein
MLFAFLVVIVLAGGTFYGYRWLAQKQASQQMIYAGLVADQNAAQDVLRESPLWAKHKAWIEAQEPVLGDEGEAKSQVLAYVLKGARDHKLDIVEQSLNDTERGAAGTRINVSVKVKGSMQDLVEWVRADLQNKSEQFYAVTLFSLKADSDQKSMVCTLQVARYFKSGS